MAYDEREITTLAVPTLGQKVKWRQFAGGFVRFSHKDIVFTHYSHTKISN